MTSNLARLPTPGRAPAASYPGPTPTAPPTMLLILADNRFDTAPWNAAEALGWLKAKAQHLNVRDHAIAHRQSLASVDRVWLKNRLTMMSMAFGHEREERRLTAWLSETGRLLIDLPGDILAEAIDEAIKTSGRGFMPQVGQIRAIADPVKTKREQEALRLEAIVALMDEKVTGQDPEHDQEPAEDRCPPNEVEEANRLFRKLGLKTRYRVDGSAYQEDDQ